MLTLPFVHAPITLVTGSYLKFLRHQIFIVVKLAGHEHFHFQLQKAPLDRQFGVVLELS